MGLLGAVKEWFVGPPRTDFYGIAKHARRVPPAELAVAEAALAGGGPLAERFVAQLREASDVWRVASEGGSYELRVSTKIGARGVPRAGWRSQTIAVRALPGDRALEMQLVVPIAGIVEIHGRTLDGEPWPADWSIDPEGLEAIQGRAPWMRLPTPAELRTQRTQAVAAIETWLGEPGALHGKRGVVSVEPAATRAAIAAFEGAQRFELPDAYRELLLVANGFQIGSIVMLGTDDAYRLDIPGPDRLVVAPPDEEGALVLAPTGEVRFVELAGATSEGRVRAPDLREWLRRRVRPAAKR